MFCVNVMEFIGQGEVDAISVQKKQLEFRELRSQGLSFQDWGQFWKNHVTFTGNINRQPVPRLSVAI